MLDVKAGEMFPLEGSRGIQWAELKTRFIFSTGYEPFVLTSIHVNTHIPPSPSPPSSILAAVYRPMHPTEPCFVPLTPKSTEGGSEQQPGAGGLLLCVNTVFPPMTDWL